MLVNRAPSDGNGRPFGGYLRLAINLVSMDIYWPSQQNYFVQYLILTKILYIIYNMVYKKIYIYNIYIYTIIYILLYI